MTDIWQRHIERQRRRLQLERFNQWCLDHPRRADLLSAGLAFIIFGIAQLIELGLDRLAKVFSP